MADIKLKHPAATIDTQIDRVISGAAVTDNTDSVVTPDGKKPVSGEGILKALNEGIEAGLAGLMPATPSGDPMHYMFEQYGARWNATTGFWEMNELTDLTNEDLRKAWDTRFFPSEGMRVAPRTYRTNFFRWIGYIVYDVRHTGSVLFADNTVLEVVKVHDPALYPAYCWRTQTIERGFRACRKLRKIIGYIEVQETLGYTNAFLNCEALEEVYLKKINGNVSLAQSSRFKKEPLLYMINESAATSPIIITLHADVYAWASTDTEVQTALASKPNITIASA